MADWLVEGSFPHFSACDLIVFVARSRRSLASRIPKKENVFCKIELDAGKPFWDTAYSRLLVTGMSRNRSAVYYGEVLEAQPPEYRAMFARILIKLFEVLLKALSVDRLHGITKL